MLLLRSRARRSQGLGCCTGRDASRHLSSLLLHEISGMPILSMTDITVVSAEIDRLKLLHEKMKMRLHKTVTYIIYRNSNSTLYSTIDTRTTVQPNTPRITLETISLLLR